jgi:hypothetical protein
MSDNLKLWENVRRPPESALKGFKRGGGFSGTAIKPMWAIQTMTEQFGPCGEGWGINEPQFTTLPANNEILVYCTVSVWHSKRENAVFGVGGDKVLVSQSNGLRTDDEAFKKAYTDAITNALKHLGVGADIHMGLWDGSKYADEPEGPANNTLPPTHPNMVKNSMGEKDRLCKELDDIHSMAVLNRWKAENTAAIEALSEQHFFTVSDSYKAKKRELEQKAAA